MLFEDFEYVACNIYPFILSFFHPCVSGIGSMAGKSSAGAGMASQVKQWKDAVDQFSWKIRTEARVCRVCGDESQCQKTI